jgi:energy-converting hydrogenase B subunit D
MIIETIHVILLAGIVGTAFMALKSRDLLASVIYLAAMSLVLSVEFYMLQAPDVAIAEAAVGAGLTTAIFVIAINRTERYENVQSKGS